MEDWNDASQEVATQPDTQPTEDPRKIGDSAEEYEHLDLADVFCILHPISMPAFITTNKIHERSPQLTCSPEIARDNATTATRSMMRSESSDIAPTSFDLAAQGLRSYDLVLRFSQPSKSPEGGFTFGRNWKKCDFGLYTNQTEGKPRISNIHFRIFLSEHGILLLEDYSTNGTVVDSRLHRKIDGIPTRRTIQNGSVITFMKPRSGAEVMKFIVRIPTREGLDEDMYDQRLQSYIAKYYPNDPGVVAQANEIALARQDRNQAPDIFENGINQVTARVRGNRHRIWHGGEKYNKQEILGRGAYATVYKLTTKTNGIVYAAKEIDKAKFQRSDSKKLTPEELMKKITNEMNIMRRIKHSNIVAFVEHIDFYDKLYIIMEYVPGGDLASQIYSGNLLTEGGAMLMSLQMLNALKWIHARGIAHRDIKPENILMMSKEPFQAKLADFGLAKLLEEGDGSFLRSFCGTLLYCAPEVYDFYREFDFVTGAHTRPGMFRSIPNLGYNNKVDVWSLGAVLFHAITGEVPWPTEPEWGHREYLTSIMTSQPDFSKVYIERGHSWEACEFLSKMLTKRHDHRSPVGSLLDDPWLNPARSIYAQQQAAAHALEDEDDLEVEEVDLIGAESPEDLVQNASQLSIEEPDLGNGDLEIGHTGADTHLDPVVPVPPRPTSSDSTDEFALDAFDASAFLHQAIEDGRMLGGQPAAALVSSGVYNHHQIALSTTALSGRQREWDLEQQRTAIGQDTTALSSSFDADLEMDEDASTIIEDGRLPPVDSNDDMDHASDTTSNVSSNLDFKVDEAAPTTVDQHNRLAPVDENFVWNATSDHHTETAPGSLLGAESLVGNLQMSSFIGSNNDCSSRVSDCALMPPPPSSLNMRARPQIVSRSCNNVTIGQQSQSSIASRRRDREDSTVKNTRQSKRPATKHTMSQASMAQRTNSTGEPPVIASVEHQRRRMSVHTVRSNTSTRSRIIETSVQPELFWDPRDRSTHVQDDYGITGDELHEMMDEATARGTSFFSNSPSFFAIRDAVRARTASRSVSVEQEGAGAAQATSGVNPAPLAHLAEYIPEGTPDTTMPHNGWRSAVLDPIDRSVSQQNSVSDGHSIEQVQSRVQQEVMFRSFEQMPADYIRGSNMSAVQQPLAPGDLIITGSNTSSSDLIRQTHVVSIPCTTQIMDPAVAFTSHVPTHSGDVVHDANQAMDPSQSIRSMSIVVSRGTAPLLARLRSSRDSVMNPILIHLYSPVTVWGRGAHTSPSYYRPKENRIPIYAFKLAIYTPENPDTDDHRNGRFWISPMNHAGIYINEMHVATAEYSQPFKPSITWIELFQHDQITVFKAGDPMQHNTFRFECFAGLSDVTRPGGPKGPLNILRPGSAEQIALDTWVLSVQHKMRAEHERQKDNPGYQRNRVAIFNESENVVFRGRDSGVFRT